MTSNLLSGQNAFHQVGHLISENCDSRNKTLVAFEEKVSTRTVPYAHVYLSMKKEIVFKDVL